MKILTIFGTRPEAIKLAPVIHELEASSIHSIVCVTGQHRQMLDQMLKFFNIMPDFDLDIMKESQTLDMVSAAILENLSAVLSKEKPDAVIVQGDTSTAFIGALCAFYRHIPVFHVEAGLRTDNKHNPFPEEMNRRLISQIADMHFAPTEQAKKNLERELVDPSDVVLTGNTVIDALLWSNNKIKKPTNESLSSVDYSKRIVLLTAHRRENLGEGLRGIFHAVNQILDKHKDVVVVFPVHLNPEVRRVANEILKDSSRVIMTEPLDYPDLVYLLNKCYLVMTDSGGIQEEAPTLGKPVAVLRENTERPEGIKAGTAVLVGNNTKHVFFTIDEILSNPERYKKMANAVNPYGDGKASTRIVQSILKRLR